MSYWKPVQRGNLFGFLGGGPDFPKSRPEPDGWLSKKGNDSALSGRDIPRRASPWLVFRWQRKICIMG